MKLRNKSVNIAGLKHIFWPKLFEVDRYWRIAAGYELVITYGSNGVHAKNSAHYRDEAIDMRTWESLTDYTQLTGTRRTVLHNGVRKIMGSEFIVLDEDDDEGHFHIQLRKKHVTQTS